MASVTLESMAIAGVIFVFMAIFGGSIFLTHYTNYGVSMDNNITNLTSYDRYNKSFSVYTKDIEDEDADVRGTSDDGDNILDAIPVLKEIRKIRTIYKQMFKDTRSILTYVPGLVWDMLIIIIGIIVAILFVGVIWRYSQGLNR